MPSIAGICTLFSRWLNAASLWVHLLAVNLFAAREMYLEGAVAVQGACAEQTTDALPCKHGMNAGCKCCSSRAPFAVVQARHMAFRRSTASCCA
jgi:hypothetical protein